MRILFVSAVLPYPLYSGGQIRIYNLLKRLSKNHEITLCAFIRSDSEKQYLKELSFCKKIIPVHRGRAWQAAYITKSLVSSYPFLMETYHNAEMENVLTDELSNHHFDLIHLEPGYVWPSLPTTKIPVVVCEHNVEHNVYEGFVRQFRFSPFRPFLSWDVSKLKFWEKRIWKEVAKITAVSQNDKEEIEQISGRNDVAIVPNGVDLETFPFHPKKNPVITSLNFLYIGNFKWMENRDAAENILQNYWPVIRRNYPGAQLRIVGKYAPNKPYYFGDVRNIQAEMERADILLTPIRIGGGTKYKILEAMAAGLPVITTTVGAAGMDAKALWIADTPAATVQEIHAIVENSGKTEKARDRIEQEYNWDTIAETLDRVWRSV